jgi:hypothetical protein
MRHTLFSNRLDSMFNQLNSYNNNTNIRIIEKDIKHIGSELDHEFNKISKPGTATTSFISPHKNSSKFKSQRQINQMDALADNIIAKLKKREQSDMSGQKSMGSTFYKKKPMTSAADSKNSTQSFMMRSGTTGFQDTTYTDNKQSEEYISPRHSINKLLKQKLNSFSKGVNMKPIKLTNIPSQGELDKVVTFKTNTGINKFLIRDYTMGQYSTTNSKRNMNITETFYDNIRKKKETKMKKDIKKFYLDKYGDDVIIDNSFSTIKAESEKEGEGDSNFERFNFNNKKYQKVRLY